MFCSSKTMAAGEVMSKNTWAFDPRTIAGCALWLDATDSNTLFQDTAGTNPVTASGQSVGRWLDKSVNSNHAISNVSSNWTRPVYTSGVLNNYGAVRLSNATGTGPGLILTYALQTPNAWFGVIRASDSSTTFLSAVPPSGNASPYYMQSRYTIGNSSAGYSVTNTGETNYAVNTGGATASNVFHVVAGVFTGTTIGTDICGNALINAAFVGTSKTANITAFGPNWFNGWGATGTHDIAEFIAFSNVLSETQRQQVEGYLSWKWGLNTNFAVRNQYYTQSPYSRVFNPLDVSGCVLWLDGADIRSMFQNTAGTTPVTASGQNVALWKDKSGVFNNASAAANQPTALFNATNNQAAVSFNGSTQIMSLTPSLLPTGTNQSTYMFVVYPTGGATGTIFTVGTPGTGTQEQIYVSGANQTLTADLCGGSFINDTTSNVGNWTLASITYGATENGWRNGVAFNGTNGIAITLNTGTSFALLGAQSNGGLYYYSGYIAEGLAYNRVLSSNERQALEGYLSWKWGIKITYNIPNTPTAIPGCALWLDAADPSSMNLSGTSITQWNDKSGAGLNLATTTNFPTLVTGGLNGSNIVSFNGNQNISRTNVTGSNLAGSTTSLFSAFIVCSYSNNIQSNIPINWDDSTFTNRITHQWIPPSGTGFDFGNLTNGNSRTFISATTFTPSNNVYYVYSFTASNTVASLYVNGGIYRNINSALPLNNFSASTRTLNVGFFSSSNSSLNMKGNTAEIIFYSNALTDPQRQQVENYLAYKWGLNTTTFSNLLVHPFRTLTTAATMFTPRNISGCQLWFDGADPSYMTLSGTSILTWKDKSGNARDASANRGVFAQYSSNTNLFNSRMAPFCSNQSRYVLPTFTPSTTGDLTFFVVGKQMVALTGNADIFIADSYIHFDFFLSNTGGAPIYIWSGGGTNLPYASSFTTTGAVPFNACATVSALSGGNSTRAIYVNGSSYGSPTNITVAGNTLNAPRSFTLAGTSTSLVANICEVIMYNTVLNTTDRQRVEGYLAQKWGMLSNLSAGHPYQKVAT